MKQQGLVTLVEDLQTSSMAACQQVAEGLLELLAHGLCE
jgi:hypothetical protein